MYFLWYLKIILFSQIQMKPQWFSGLNISIFHYHSFYFSDIFFLDTKF